MTVSSSTVRAIGHAIIQALAAAPQRNVQPVQTLAARSVLTIAEEFEPGLSRRIQDRRLTSDGLCASATLSDASSCASTDESDEESTEEALERALELVEKLQHHTVRLETALDEAEARASGSERELTAIKDRLACSATENERLLLAAEDRDAAFNSQASRINAMEAKIAALDLELDEAAWMLVYQESKITTLQSELDDATRELERQGAKIVTLQSELEDTTWKLERALHDVEMVRQAAAYTDKLLESSEIRLEVAANYGTALVQEVARLEGRERDLQLENAAASERLQAQLENTAACRLADAEALDEARRLAVAQSGCIDELERTVASLKSLVVSLQAEALAKAVAVTTTSVSSTEEALPAPPVRSLTQSAVTVRPSAASTRFGFRPSAAVVRIEQARQSRARQGGCAVRPVTSIPRPTNKNNGALQRSTATGKGLQIRSTATLTSR